MTDESSEKQHSATGKRLTEMRRKGQVMRSRDLSGGLIIIISIAMIIFMSHQFKLRFEKNFLSSFGNINQVANGNDYLIEFLKEIAVGNLMLLIPIFTVVLIATFLSPFIFGGWNFSLESVQFNFGKMNPLNFLKKTFSMQIVVEMVRSILKFVVIMAAFISFVSTKRVAISELMRLPLKTAVSRCFTMAEQFIILLTICIVFLILFDVIYNYFEYQKKSKMTTQEIKDESKDTDGRPEVKRKIRSAQMALLKQRLNVSVPQASVIITNPTHYAIALRYDEKKDYAPRLVAKGKDLMAQQIRNIAIANAIPIYEAPPLARAIFHTSEIGSEIHPDLYMAVAIVLSYVHQLKNYQQGIGQPPRYVSDFNIPEEFKY